VEKLAQKAGCYPELHEDSWVSEWAYSARERSKVEADRVRVDMHLSKRKVYHGPCRLGFRNPQVMIQVGAAAGTRVSTRRLAPWCSIA